MNVPIYVYDMAGNFKQPIFVVYDESHINMVIDVLFAGVERPSLYITTTRQHPHDGNTYSLRTPNKASHTTTPRKRKRWH
jgi:hypothetical protein